MGCSAGHPDGVLIGMPDILSGLRPIACAAWIEPFS
jgi:hypothetical protein